ncbi:MAG: T9SS type A sorting domain-containing protein [Flavobacteriia bacterium]|nr:T9SS type A sorting domain-containing protein [Flavobacteriia bacterium]
MRKIILSFFLITTYFYIAQTPQFNLEKYWFYRERFKKFYVSVGTGHGQGLVIPARSTNEVCGSNQVFPYDQEFDSILKLNDLTAHQGWYIALLATEYELLKRNYRSTNEVLHELYCALYALNRLDTYDPFSYLGNDALDGFMVREDFPSDFLEQHPELKATQISQAERDKWNINQSLSHNGYANNCFISKDDENVEKGYGKYNEMALSMDHYVRLLMGLALVTKFIPLTETYNNTAFQDGLFSIKIEAQAIATRIVTYMKTRSWLLYMPNLTAAQNNLDPYLIQHEYCVNPQTLYQLGEPCVNCPALPYLVPGSQIPQYGILVPRGCIPFTMAEGFALAGGAILSNFDNTAPAYKTYFLDPLQGIDGVVLSSHILWQSLGNGLAAITQENKPGTLAYMLELAAIGDSWNPNIASLGAFDFNNIDELIDLSPLDLSLSDLTQKRISNNDIFNWNIYNLLHASLWDVDLELNNNVILERINTAPCSGPDGGDYMWYDNNSLETNTYQNQPGEGDVDSYPTEKLNGLDYMLLFNLFLLNYPNYVEYNRVYVGTDMALSGNLPFVVPFPNCSFTGPLLTAVGTSSTGTFEILPEPLEFFCVGKITTNQKLEHKNLSGFYQSVDINCMQNGVTEVDIEINTTINAVTNVIYKATDELEVLDGFEGEEGNEFAFIGIEFKCNESGTAYESPKKPDDYKRHEQKELGNNVEKEKVDQAIENGIKKKSLLAKNEIERLILYPNPIEDQLTIQLFNPIENKQTEDYILTLKDMFGSDVFVQSFHFDKSIAKINFEKELHGMFIAKITNSTGNETIRKICFK